MKSFKIAKYQVMEILSSIRTFYAIFLLVIVLLSILSFRSGGAHSSSGLDFASWIFLFIAGLNAFKRSFYFSQANNISRKTFFKGLVMGVFPITFAMSVIDVVINRIYNNFVPSPTNFDMIYSSFRDTDMRYGARMVWTPANDIYTLFSTAIWQFALYSMIFLLGILITLIYYRSSKLVKVIVSVLPIALIIFSNIIYQLLPVAFWESVGALIAGAFGWESRNPYMAVLSFGILASLFSGVAYLLTRRAVVKD